MTPDFIIKYQFFYYFHSILFQINFIFNYNLVINSVFIVLNFVNFIFINLIILIFFIKMNLIVIFVRFIDLNFLINSRFFNPNFTFFLSMTKIFNYYFHSNFQFNFTNLLYFLIVNWLFDLFLKSKFPNCFFHCFENQDFLTSL